MLANRPRGISINKNAANVQANNIQALAPAGVNNLNLKRSLNQEFNLPFKKASTKTPSPPKFKSTQINNNVKQSENDVPTLVDLKITNHDLKSNVQPPKPPTLKINLPEKTKKNEPVLQLRESVTVSSAPASQTVISRIPRLREVEEEIEDIDKSCSHSRDAIFQVCDLAKDIYSYMYELETVQSVKEDFLKEQKIFTPKVRHRLVSWCVDLTRKLELLPETTYMTISILDRYFEIVVVKHQSHVQLVALGALLVASKYEEIYPPDVNDLIAYSENVYSRRDILRMEIDILDKLDFSLGRPIPPAFLRRFSRAAHCDLKMHSIAKFLMEISLPEYECAHWKPSLLAAAALFTTVNLVYNNNRQTQLQDLSNTGGMKSSRLSAAIGLTRSCSTTTGSFGLQRKLVSGPPIVQERWSKALVHYTGYTRRDLQAPAATLCKILKKVLKTPHLFSIVKRQEQNLAKWTELKSTRVDELIRLGESVKS